MKRIINSAITVVLVWVGLTGFSACSSSSESAAPVTTGTGGSMARFTIAGDYLYTVSNTDLNVFDIRQTANPTSTGKVRLGFGIETIFPYNNHLFIGSQTGMEIYSLATPASPEHVSSYPHVQSCDPVVVQGNFAYVTLRDGAPCRNGENLLDIVDISNPRFPRSVNAFPLQNPHGLGIDRDRLFITEGDFGLKVFDVTEPTEPSLLQFIPDIRTYDVIPRNKLLLVVGKDGLYQYDYSRADSLQLLSSLVIESN
jgi:hypothetical protein